MTDPSNRNTQQPNPVTGDDGLIEVDLGPARVRIGRKAEVGMALAVIGALRGRR